MKCSVWLLIVVFLAGTLANGDDTKADPAQKDLKTLQGTWVTLKLVINGTTLVDLKEPPKEGLISTITYDDHKWVIKLGNTELSTGTSKLDPTKTPKQIDLTNLTGPDKGQTLLAIYELDGDEYRACIAAPGKDRPTEFTSKEGSGQRLIISRKQKR